MTRFRSVEGRGTGPDGTGDDMEVLYRRPEPLDRTRTLTFNCSLLRLLVDVVLGEMWTGVHPTPS